MNEKKKGGGGGGTGVPVHLMQKGTVAKVYRYTLQVYRYTLRKKRQWPKCTGTPYAKRDSG